VLGEGELFASEGGQVQVCDTVIHEESPYANRFVGSYPAVTGRPRLAEWPT
jgi:hypothetical protein